MFALTVEQQLVVNIRQEELDAPALYAQLVLHQHDGTAVVASLWTRDHANLITEGADTEREVFTCGTRTQKNRNRGNNTLTE